jgi:DNA-directed RNA polymerase beta' subunit
MNMHVPQNIGGEIELRHLAAIPWQLVSPASNAPIIGIYQDSMLGSYRFTRPNINFNSRDAMNLLMMFNNVDVQKLREKKENISSFDILSQILPPMTTKFKTKLFGDKEDSALSNNILEIRNGEYLRGQMEKSVLGSSTKGIIHRICNDFGNMSAVDFIDNLQNIITEYMKTSSFSVGVSDLIADKKTTTEIIQVITNQKMEVQSVINEIHLGTFKNITANSNSMEFETKVNNLLNKATEQSGKIARESLNKNNRFLMIVESGSKGSLINISQMISCLGQQNVDGKRIPYGFDNRTLPHYNKFDDSPTARGFIENSYISGLTAPELFFHAMGGRIGLIDTAVKSVTWETPIVIIDNGVPLYVKIGEWIDKKLEKSPEKIEKQKEKNMELLNLIHSVYIPTTDEKGNVSWELLTAVTRHDPGERLYEVVTKSGRKVTVAESKSLLIWNPELKEFHEMNSPDVKVGDFVPVTETLCEPREIVTKIEIPFAEPIELNEQTGIFVGLFMACGMLIDDGETVVIQSDNPTNLPFIKKWATQIRFSFAGHIMTNEDDLVKVFFHMDSALTNKWLQGMKKVPSEAFVAPDSFVRGLLNGYYSARGKVKNNKIVVSGSPLLLEGISMLCSRLGIFGEIYENQFRIYSSWSVIFSEKISLLNPTLSLYIDQIFEDYTLYKTHNNCVLDPIVSINIIGTENHPKLYDVTVPKTLNFCLANGLQVRDTSTTGYIQRRLIKGLEDLKIEYDMTVRNSKGKIVQFAYGDDNFESTKVEHQFLPLVEMSIEEIYMHYDIVGLNDYDSDLLQIYSKGTLSRMKKQKVESKEICKKYIDKMVVQRDHIVKNVFKSKNENSVKIPVSFQNIIINIQGQLNLNSNSTVDITPKEAFLLIEEYFEKLKQIHFSPPTLLFEIMYYFYLTPKDLLVHKRFHRKALVLLLETIVLKYKQSIVHPGEMVGVIAGQSIGEPTTQLSCSSSTKIIISGIHNYNGDVKTFVDQLLKENEESVIDLGNNSVVMDLKDDYHIIGVSNTEKTSWNRILQISRHPANGNLVKVTTKTGKTHTATLSHSFLKRSESGIDPVKGSDLKLGDRIPVAKFIPEITNSMTEIKIGENTVLLDKTFGKFIGSYLADGCITSNKISIDLKKDDVIKFINYDIINYLNEEFKNSTEKLIPAWVFSSNKEFIYGILSGYLSCNSEVNDDMGMIDIHDKNLIICSSFSERFIIDICLLLSYAGIYAKKDVCDGGYYNRHDNHKKLYLLYISKRYASVFKELIGFSTDCQNNIEDCKNLEWFGTEYKVKALNKVIEKFNFDEYSEKEDYDKIPELGNIIAYIGDKLDVPGQSIEYGQWKQKESIGRKTLASYIPIFEKENTQKLSLGIYKKRINNIIVNFEWTQEDYDEVASNISILRQAVYSDVIWDEIIDLEIIEDNGEFVYDFTVPGNDSFMVDCGILVHNTLNTFHLSGVASKSNVTRGVPRIEEILRLTKNPKHPSLTVHLKPYDEQEKEKATTFANMMEHTKLIDVIQLVEICFDPIEKTTFKEEDRLLMEQFYEFERMVEECMENSDDINHPQVSKWVVRMEMDPETMLDKNITMDDIHFAIKNSHYGNDIHCVYSDYNMDKLVFRIRTNSNIFSKSKKKGAIEPLDQSDEIYLLRNFQDSLLNNIVLRGIHGIENVIPRKLQNMVVKEDGKFIRKDIWVLDTTGSNLLDSLALEFIDSIRTYSNDIKEIFDVLGIEAARQVLYNELVEVMEFADVYINYHHLSLLCDRMTCTKDMVSIFRSGILNDDIGPISKSTFEVHTEVLLNAARHAEFDHMRGVSATVMMGQYGYFGTNAFNLVLDMKEMENLDVVIVEKNDTEEQIEKLFSFKETVDNDPCSGSNIEIKNNIDSIKRSNEGLCDDNYNMGF